MAWVVQHPSPASTQLAAKQTCGARGVLPAAAATAAAGCLLVVVVRLVDDALHKHKHVPVLQEVFQRVQAQQRKVRLNEVLQKEAEQSALLPLPRARPAAAALQSNAAGQPSRSLFPSPQLCAAPALCAREEGRVREERGRPCSRPTRPPLLPPPSPRTHSALKLMHSLSAGCPALLAMRPNLYVLHGGQQAEKGVPKANQRTGAMRLCEWWDEKTNARPAAPPADTQAGAAARMMQAKAPSRGARRSLPVQHALHGRHNVIHLQSAGGG